MSKLCRNVIMKPTNLNAIANRTFWKISEIEMIGYVKSVGKHGYIFQHDNVVFSVDKSINRCVSYNVVNSFSVSLNKYGIEDKNYLITKMKNQEPIYIVVETHMFGRPSQGFINNPHYIKKIHPYPKNEYSEEKIDFENTLKRYGIGKRYISSIDDYLNKMK